MEQKYIAHAAMTQYPTPMEDYYDEASKQNFETPGDYSSADGSDN
jgi:hypothetical protein